MAVTTALVVGAAATAYSAYSGAQAAKSAAKAQQAGYDAASAESARQYDQTRADWAPWRDIGNRALNTLGSVYGYNTEKPLSFEEWSAKNPASPSSANQYGGSWLGRTMGAVSNASQVAGRQKAYDQYVAGFSPSKPATAPDYSAFFKSPDYQFRLNEGQRDIGNSFAARGGAASGNALRALTQYNQNLASGEFGNWFNRQSSLAGLGQAATSATTSAGMQNSANIQNNLIGGANARASGIVGAANSYNNGINNLVGMGAYGYGQGWWGGKKNG